MNSLLEPADLVEWIPVAIGQRAQCDHCGQTLRPNDRLEALVTATGSFDTELVVCRCGRCSKGSLRDGTERPCLLVRGRLAASVDAGGHSRVVLSGAEIVDRSE
ncbi:hypothetical protein Htur_5106 (plasmid) [Haloterrigena turkmenica DSM 5511]|uniref:Uncharacterized protein n=1 Tax=Haloterrigena turkmenica (strain ATCC 51198 / DSM 5511 / JCM 9101 / NCIMB 13204 / VKM B-1734 / 4k) TaxID=543526 RepID=D2S3P6_HALTV|nr:hypothetical protein [Haloterrigena turkmenica]ADB63993.1 hypothetical protein Htur_5106 [Haloterrigena turkmenica DSM 5511]